MLMALLLLYLETNKRLEEELEVYGSGLKTSVQLTSYTFEVCKQAPYVIKLFVNLTFEYIC